MTTKTHPLTHPLPQAPMPQPRQASTAVRAALRALPGGRSEQLCLPYEYEVSPGVPAVPPVPAHLRVVGSDTLPALDPRLPDPGRWAAKIAQAAAEVAIGARPPAQLNGHVERGVLAQLARRGQQVARHPSARAQRGVARLRMVRSVRTCPVADGVVECCVVLVSGDRAQAIALRLEADDDRWLATVVQVG
ncbi:MAG: hypothetical protein GC156_08655 [Actinomycetales bacterium]|nr:hypothetical protein [Actinomycetales bacterium]